MMSSSLIHMIILNLGNTTCQNCSASTSVDDTEIPDIINETDKSAEVDLTDTIVTVVGKTLALAYCVGLVVIVLYYCYVMPSSGTGGGHLTVSISCRQHRSRRRRGGLAEGREGRTSYKDLPPSYESIHLSDLPPHYEDVTKAEIVSYQKHFAQTIIHC